MEVFDIGITDVEPITLKFEDIPVSNIPTSSPGGLGLELLMNDKKRTSSMNVHMDLGDVDKLEAELNELSNPHQPGMSTKSIDVNAAPSNNNGGGGFFSDTTKSISNLFGFGSSNNATANTVSFDTTSDSKLGGATKETGSAKTWDGFSKTADISSSVGGGETLKMNEREKRRKKRAMLKKLEEWRNSGKISKESGHFTMDSSYEEIEDEYETAMDDKRKKDSIKLQGWWFMTAINSIEYMNAMFNPFDLNLDGWGEQIAEDIDSYEDIFSELHEKYKGGKMSPEVSLLLRIGFSAAVVNFSNKALSTATPGFNDVIKQSPELMKMFTDATVQSMSQQSPGFAFASSMMNKPDQVNTSFGPPPKPIETRPPVKMQFTEQMPNRPDLAMGRGTKMNAGVDINQGFASTMQPDQRIQTPAPGEVKRPEMKGPSTDVDHIFAGLKTKASTQPLSGADAINSMFLPREQPQAASGPRVSTPVYNANISLDDVEDDSIISISSLKDLQNPNMPKKSSGRRRKSDRNTVSLSLDL